MKVKLDSKQGVEVLAETLDVTLDGFDVHSLKERIMTCLMHNTVAASKSKTRAVEPETHSAALQNHISTLKSTIDKQRMDVPQLVMKQTTAHLEALKSFEGALSQINTLQKDSAAASWKCGGEQEATDVKLALLGRCELLPELQTRLQNATRKLGKILSEIDSQRRRDAPVSLLA